MLRSLFKSKRSKTKIDHRPSSVDKKQSQVTASQAKKSRSAQELDSDLSSLISKLTQLQSEKDVTKEVLDLRRQIKNVVKQQLVDKSDAEILSYLDASSQDYVKAVALGEVKEIKQAERLVEELSPQGHIEVVLEQLALPIRLKALSQIDAENDLVFLQKQLKNRDKTLFKSVKEKLKSKREELQKEAERAEQLKSLSEKLEALPNTAISPQLPLELKSLENKWQSLEPLSEQNEKAHIEQLLKKAQAFIEAHKNDLASLLTESQATELQQKVVKSLEAQKQETLAMLDTDEINLEAMNETLKKLRQDWKKSCEFADPESDLAYSYNGLNKELESLYLALSSYYEKKDRVNKLLSEADVGLDARLKQVRKLLKSLHWPSEFTKPKLLLDLENKAQELKSELDKQEKAEQDNIQQTLKLKRIIESQVKKGTLRPADRLFEKLEDKFAELSSSSQKRLEKGIEKLKQSLHEMKDWQGFVTEPKQQELVEKMRELVSFKGDLEVKAQRIRQLQDEWRSLGYSQDQEVYEQFRELADEAYRPCALHFEKKKQQREQNKQKKLAICEELSTFCNSVKLADITWEKLAEIKKQAREDWRRFSPVEHHDVKQLNEQFKQCLKQIDNLIDTKITAIEDDKKRLVAQAEKLLTVEELNQAIDQAKLLQSRWKEVPRLPYKKEQSLWAEFRSHLDQVFGKRNEVVAEQKQQQSQAYQQARQIIDALEAKQGFKDFADLSDVDQLKEQFLALEDLPKAKQQTLRKHYEMALKAIDKEIQQKRKAEELEDIQALQTVSQKCFEIEKALLDEAFTDETLKDFVEQKRQEMSELKFHANTWHTMGQERQALCEKFVESVESLGEALQSHTEQKLQLCLEMEILTGQETPEAFKEQRMALQVKKLSDQMMSDKGAENSFDSALNLFKRWIGIGLARNNDELQERFDTAFNRVLD